MTINICNDCPFFASEISSPTGIFDMGIDYATIIHWSSNLFLILVYGIALGLVISIIFNKESK
jgi:hypothetical protein